MTDCAIFEKIETYESTYSVRRVVLGTGPSTTDGTAAVGSGNANTETVTFSSVFASLAGFVGTASADTSGLFHYPASITNTTSTSAVLYFGTGSSATVGGVVTQFPNNRQVMSFYLDFGDWYVVKNIFELRDGDQLSTTQVYDFYYVESHLDSMGHTRTLSRKPVRPEDIAQIYAWQDDLNSRLPAGSNFKLEFAINGNGILGNISSPLLIQLGTPPVVSSTYAKPLGTGTSLWPASYSTSWTNLGADPLFAFFTASQANQNRVNWLTHTFTHESLDSATTYDVAQEIQVNVKMAQTMGLVGQSWWSPGSIITPAITGLFNGDALSVFTANGIVTAVGDNSRSALVPSNKYLDWVSTQASSNFDGFHVIPRQPAEVYYTSDTVTQNVQIYNSIYSSQLGTSNWTQILDREVARVVPMLMSLRHDPHMFHQANLRNIDQPIVTVGGKTGRLSLLQQWVEAIVAKYTATVTWPIQGLKMDDLALLYRERESRETCGISTTLNVATGVVSSVTVKTTNACKVGVTLPPGVTPASGSWTTEK
ncbi:hypothetical protein HDU93_001780, partial [Gonapodya sp. JEL0774]